MCIKGRVLNKHVHGIPQGASYIGRGSRHGNQFRIGAHGTREQVIDQHKRSIARNISYLASLDELRGQDVVCFCAPQACHGDTLVMLAAMAFEDRLAWAAQVLAEG